MTFFGGIFDMGAKVSEVSHETQGDHQDLISTKDLFLLSNCCASQKSVSGLYYIADKFS